MSDQWKASVRTIAGHPVAVVDVTITRTLLIDAEAYERISSVLSGGAEEKSGLKEVDDFYKLVEHLPPESRRFVVVPWTDAESKKIGLRSFAEILRVFEDRAYWRIEGSAAEGFRGYFNFGGQDHLVDLSEAKIPLFQAQLNQTRQEVEAARKSGKLTQDEQDRLNYICDVAGRESVACEEMYKAYAQMLRERERQERERQEKELRDRERERNDEGFYQGDFPDGWGGGFGDIG